MTNPTPRIGLIVPASNTAAEVQFQRHAPAGVVVHTTRLRMTGQWSRLVSNSCHYIPMYHPTAPIRTIPRT